MTDIELLRARARKGDDLALRAAAAWQRWQDSEPNTPRRRHHRRCWERLRRKALLTTEGSG